MLRHVEYPANVYSNWHEGITFNGYCDYHPAYALVLARDVLATGVHKVPVVHCTYLVKKDAIPKLSYLADTTGRHEYVIFSETARANNVAQFLDNRDDYGVISFECGET